MNKQKKYWVLIIIVLAVLIIGLIAAAAINRPKMIFFTALPARTAKTWKTTLIITESKTNLNFRNWKFPAVSPTRLYCKKKRGNAVWTRIKGWACLSFLTAKNVSSAIRILSTTSSNNYEKIILFYYTRPGL